jgi:hypothetical protein
MRTVFELNQGLTMKNFKRCTPPTKVKVHTDIPLIIPACGLPKYEHDCIGSCTLLGFPEHPHGISVHCALSGIPYTQGTINGHIPGEMLEIGMCMTILNCTPICIFLGRLEHLATHKIYRPTVSEIWHKV